MIEISYLTQDGEKIYLKDAKGRELLESKQPKLKAGNGISIAADGTISTSGLGGGKFKKYVAENIHLISDDNYFPFNSSEDIKFDVTFKLEFSYCGNLALINSVVAGDSSYSDWERMQNSSWGNWWDHDSTLLSLNGKIKTCADSDFQPKGVDALINTEPYRNEKVYFSAAQTARGLFALFGYLADNETFEDTGEDYLYIVTSKVYGKDNTSNGEYAERDSAFAIRFVDTHTTITDDNNGKTYRCVFPTIIGKGFQKGQEALWKFFDTNPSDESVDQKFNNKYDFIVYRYACYYSGTSYDPDTGEETGRLSSEGYDEQYVNTLAGLLEFISES